MVNSTTRFLAVDSAKVDLKERKDKLNNSKTEYLSLDDIRGYKVYTALLTQSGTDAPVATVLENTLGGDIVWSRDGEGNYIGTLNNAFPSNKYFAPMPINGFDSAVNYGGGNEPYFYARLDDNSISIITADDQLLDSPIEIRVYN